MFSLDRTSEVPGQGARADEITRQYRAELGKKFRRLSPERQKAFAEYAIAASCLDHHEKLYLSILFDRKFPPDIEWHRRRWNVFLVCFADREQAIAWIINAYSLGHAVHFQSSWKSWGSGLFHPCNEGFGHEAMREWERGAA